MRDPFETLVAAAVLAPSGDNTQPWRFAIDSRQGLVAVSVDESRDASPMNAGQRMSRIAVGAAAENMLRAASHNGWPAELDAAGERDTWRIRVNSLGSTEREIPDVIARRVTNRRFYDGRPITAELRDRLEQIAVVPSSVRANWIYGRDRIRQLAKLIGRSDGVMFGEPAMRSAFLANVRFEVPPRAPVDEGLSLGSLEVSRPQSVALQLLGRTPNWVVRLGCMTSIFAVHSRRLVAGASGICLISAEGDSPGTDFAVGRGMQSVWLALTEMELAVQPMMSLPVLQSALTHQFVADNSRLLGRIEALDSEFRRLVPEVGDGRPAFLLRFGYAGAPTGRTGRREISDVIEREF